MNTLSVLTIARGRDSHLENLVIGLTRQSRLPDELVVVHMQASPYDLPDTPFPVRQFPMHGDALPLAAARNLAAGKATGRTLAFLDVDCIPDPELCADYGRAVDDETGLLMGEVLYLPKGANRPGWRYDDFERRAVRHSDRRGPPESGLARCNDYRCFWSLNFALSARIFHAHGGFDEAYRGYGGEDTDFGKTLDTAGVPIQWMRGARVYHQHHAHHMPPLHHLDSVIRNSELFGAKWGYRTMEHWLKAFRMMGLIETTPDGIRVVREPGPADFDLTRQDDDAPYLNTAKVIRQLERRVAETMVDS